MESNWDSLLEISTIILRGGGTTVSTPKEYSREVGLKLRHFRNDRGMSQEQVALASGLNTNSIGMIERGVKSPTISTLKRICDSLEISLAELFLYEGDNSQAESAVSAQKAAAMIRKLPAQDAIRVARIVEQAVEIGRE